MGIAYIDDLRLIVLANDNSSESIPKSQNLINSFLDDLQDFLTLEVEPNEHNSFRFFGSLPIFQWYGIVSGI